MSGKVVHPPGSIKLASVASWLESTTVAPDGTITLRFAEGRTIDSIVLLNDKHQELHRAVIRAMPGEALVIGTRVLIDVAELALPVPTEDALGFCSLIARLQGGTTWLFLRRVPGHITDTEVARELGGGTFRIDTIRMSPSGTQERTARRVLRIDASWRGY